MALVPGFALACVMMLLAGFAAETRQTGTLAVLQLAIHNDQRGRVMSLQYMFQRLAMGLGTYTVGAVAEATGVRMPLFVLAGASALVGFAMLASRKRVAAAFVVEADVYWHPSTTA